MPVIFCPISSSLELELELELLSWLKALKVHLSSKRVFLLSLAIGGLARLPFLPLVS